LFIHFQALFFEEFFTYNRVPSVYEIPCLFKLLP